MFRKLAYAIVGLLLSGAVVSGEYDGVWVFDFAVDPNSDYFILYQKGNALLLVSAYREMDGWEALMGDFVTESSARVSSLLNSDGTSVVLTVNFTSSTTATVTLDSCAPQAECDIPVGLPLSTHKIF